MTYLHGQNEGIILSVILTLSQLAACFSVVDIRLRRETASYVIVVSHAIATFATNCSMAFMSASSTFAIKLMEPITTAVVQRLVLSTSLSTSTLISLPLIVSGAVVFAVNPLSTTSLSLGVSMAMVSNIILAVRNIAVKSRQSESKEMHLRSRSHTYCVIVSTLTFTAAVYTLESRNVLPSKFTLTAASMLVSSLLHVVYSYVSTNVVLRYMTVVSHAVSNILKRLLVVLLLYTFGQRHATPWNFAGLVVCTLGLAVYVRGIIAAKKEDSAILGKSVNIKKVSTLNIA